jgi:hypothetical protein
MQNLRWIAGLLMALWLPACGGSSTPTTAATPAPTPTPCTQTIVLQVSGAVPASTLGRRAFSAATAGRLDVTVDWTFATSPIGVYLVTAGGCPIDLFNAQACTFLTRSETATKPRKISVPNVAAGNYELLVANFEENQDESISGQVVLSSSTCPPFGLAGGEGLMGRFGRRLSESTLR